ASLGHAKPPMHDETRIPLGQRLQKAARSDLVSFEPSEARNLILRPCSGGTRVAVTAFDAAGARCRGPHLSGRIWDRAGEDNRRWAAADQRLRMRARALAKEVLDQFEPGSVG